MKTLRLIATALLALAGCGKRETAVEAGIRTQTLIVGNLSEPATLDPGVCESASGFRIIGALFETLTWIDVRTSQPVPAAAERWEMSPDGLTWTFHLRPDGRWSNGDPVTAHDFVFSIRRMFSPKLASSIAYIFYSLKNAEAFTSGKLTDASAVGVAAIDDRTLRFTLARPILYFPALASGFLPLHRASIEKCGAVEDRASPWARPGQLVGNGPFVLAEWRPQTRIVVRKNPHYWDAARNGLEQVVFLPTESPDVEERDFRAGQVHVTGGMPTAKIPRYRERESAKLRHDPLLGNIYLSFNVRHRLLGDARVRRALSLAIDREPIVAAVFYGSQQPAAHFTPPNCGGYTTRARVPTDFATARRLLAEAGFPGGKGLTGLEIHVGRSVENLCLCEALQETWRRELGVHVGIAPAEEKIVFDNHATGNFSILFIGWLAGFADPTQFMEIYLTNSGQNGGKWSDPEYDRLIAEAGRTLDPGRRLELFQQAEAILLEQAAVAPLYFLSANYLIHPAVKHWQPAVTSNLRYQDVRLEP
jgi:oligopeptide transport system substrate-binding protein